MCSFALQRSKRCTMQFMSTKCSFHAPAAQHASAVHCTCYRARFPYACRRDTLASMFLNSLRRGGALEAALAARCLGLQAVTLGAGEECEQCVPTPRLALPLLPSAAFLHCAGCRMPGAGGGQTGRWGGVQAVSPPASGGASACAATSMGCLHCWRRAGGRIDRQGSRTCR